MASYEPDAHGRRHRSVEIGVETFPPDFESDESYIRMSSGDVIRRDDMGEYLESFDEDEKGPDITKELLVFGSAATVSALIVALAHHRLKKNK